MKRMLVAVVVLLLGSSLSAQVRVEAGVAGGTQAYETPDLDSRFLLSPELLVSRGRLSLYYALDYAEMASAGPMYANHFGLAYRWPLPRNLSLLAGAGPSYITIEQLGGETVFNAQLELALQTGRLAWFAKVRQYDYDLAEFRIARASPDGPALLAGVRLTLTR